MSKLYLVTHLIFKVFDSFGTNFEYHKLNIDFSKLFSILFSRKDNLESHILDMSL